MIRFSCGNPWDIEFLHKVIELNKQNPEAQVVELYGSIAGATPTARSFDRIPYRDPGFLTEYIKRAQAENIAIQWTLNQSCLSAVQDFKLQWRKMLETLHSLWDMGVHHYVIAHPLIMQLMRKAFPEARLEVSTIAAVESVEQVKEWSSLGANSICGKHELNRNFRALRVLTRACHVLGMTYKVMVTEGCIGGPCIMRQGCYLASSHNSMRGPFEGWPFSYCNKKREGDPSQWLKSNFVLPQWIPEYVKTGVDYFKITGRTLPPDRIIGILEKYLSLHWSGNLLEIIPEYHHLSEDRAPELYLSCKTLDNQGFLDHFISHGHLCATSDCTTCSHCKHTFLSCLVEKKSSRSGPGSRAR